MQYTTLCILLEITTESEDWRGINIVEGNRPKRDEKDESCKDETLFQADNQNFSPWKGVVVDCHTHVLNLFYFLPESVQKDLSQGEYCINDMILKGTSDKMGWSWKWYDLAKWVDLEKGKVPGKMGW